MSTALERPPATETLAVPARTRRDLLRKTLLACGVASSLLYGTLMLVVRYPGYHRASQTVSELSAWGASTRPLWMVLGSVFDALVIACGCGVLLSSREGRELRVAGWLLIAYGALGIVWPFASMHQREVLAAGGGSLADTGHLVLAAASVILMFAAMVFGGAALRGSFRIYSFVSMAVLLVFGGLTSADAPRVQANLPTPWVGVWERVNIGVFLIWLVVLALTLWRQEASPPGMFRGRRRSPTVPGHGRGWGATDEEVRGSMPGDAIVPTAHFNGTRAIRVDAPPGMVWPWIVQMGYRRAGFYIYALLENAGFESADCVLEQYQSPRIGDWMPMAKTVNDTRPSR